MATMISRQALTPAPPNFSAAVDPLSKSYQVQLYDHLTGLAMMGLTGKGNSSELGYYAAYAARRAMDQRQENLRSLNLIG